MPEESLDDLTAFLAVAEARSFTHAAARLGMSQSAVSQTIRGLEARLGLRMLTRTTRSVAPTEAGDRLAQAIGPHIAAIRAELAALNELRDRPAGTVRISADEHAATMVLWPALATILPNHPEIEVEVAIENGLVDIVTERYDAGVRLGGLLAKDMIAVPIAPPLRMAVVGSPAYLAKRPTPTTPHELTSHRCINLRLPTHGGIYAWEFERDGREQRVRVTGQFVFDSPGLMLLAAEAGFGLAYMAEDQVRASLDEGRLVRVLEAWCPRFSGHHLYYPTRRHLSPALAFLVERLRYRGDGKDC